MLEKGIVRVKDPASKKEITKLAVKALQNAQYLYSVAGSQPPYMGEVDFYLAQMKHALKQFGK